MKLNKKFIFLFIKKRFLFGIFFFLSFLYLWNVSKILEQKNNFIEQEKSYVSYKTIIFYYGWYGNKKVNGKWLHWNHKILVQNGTEYNPPDNIGANFYPLLGPYSSLDLEIIEEHLKQLSNNRIGIICLSWWGEKLSDSQLKDNSVKGYSNMIVPLILNKAEKYNIKVCFHHEPYEGFYLEILL
jgi:glycoprotein endo-alpha-1,2-mannosidase